MEIALGCLAHMGKLADKNVNMGWYSCVYEYICFIFCVVIATTRSYSLNNSNFNGLGHHWRSQRCHHFDFFFQLVRMNGDYE